MAERSDWDSPDALVLISVLEKLRARDGLTLARLQDGRNGVAAPLLGLAATRRYATVHDIELAPAALDVVGQCVRHTMTGTDQIVADAILALGLFADEYARHNVDSRAIQSLSADALGRRRSALLGNWRRLHESLGYAPGEPPSDRVLRGTTERDVLHELARQLIRREVYSVGSKSVVTPAPGEITSASTPVARRGKVIVVGGAVMDATFRTKNMPARETSSEAYGFDLSPGGKGLTQAVAAARLGLDVALIAAVADDRFGQEIIHYLRDEGVDTSLIKVVHDARTPFTGVIEMELGDSIAVNWRNQVEVRLDVRDVDQRSQELTNCDAVLVTFEIPRETVQQTLALVHTDDDDRPMVIVTPGQPYPDETISRHSLTHIDYLVAQAWELGRYASTSQERFDPDPVARNLLAYGVETLCLLVNGGCTIYSESAHEAFLVPTFPSIYKGSSASRDAFCAALAAKLIDNDRVFSEQVALWAAAAMSCATADFPLSNSMPDRKRIEALLTRSKFTVSVR
ncbi:ribokinase [Kribbella sp. VKM Ac-2527]|uniref:Ribokinase n=1 Tax=Kribbella caucasensis TaxID=2512215 RepID=A0A4R6K734_9ACTN|nr:PfkB family carbohydrate kinase [Kribbella sp. VKM Ac-2527]TDO45256.1 ribokinase [Kribbella sp. VKM Ac-2527]